MFIIIWCSDCGTSLAIAIDRQLPWVCKCGHMVAEPAHLMLEESQELLLGVSSDIQAHFGPPGPGY